MATIQYYQNDPQWQHVKIGVNSQLTIGLVGCLLTSMTMVVNYYGANETPLSLNNKLVATNGFNGAWIKTAVVPSKFANLNFRRQKYVECKNPMPAPMADIDAGLAAGSLVVVQVDREQDRAFEEEDGHWVVLYKKEGNDYLMWDPWYSPQAPNTLLGRYGFNYKKAEEVIQAAIWHGRGELSPSPTPPQPAPPSTPPSPVPPSVKVFYVTPSSTLTLRRQPVVNGDNVLKLLPAGAVLTVLDNPAEGLAKLGQPNQWLRVREPQGTEGYVAAWLVKQVQNHTPPPRSPAPPQPTPADPTPVTPPAAPLMRITTIQDGISLRTAPVVSQETFIMSLPKGVSLEVIEMGKPGEKVGVQGQWLKVRIPNGREGYVAAWFVDHV